jgi:hypothetical protein
LRWDRPAAGLPAVLVGPTASETYGQRWRVTVAAVLLRSEATDFVGQFRRNSHVLASLRYSF